MQQLNDIDQVTIADRELVENRKQVLVLANTALNRNFLDRVSFNRLLATMPKMTNAKAVEWIEYFNKKGIVKI